ncbi:MAG TPA: alpha/beta hydrolase-fold protein [Chitinophagaceae bacterium]|nr:alpha/beta hydrolase-fold protein [Chitinophagaceae bacterium]
MRAILFLLLLLNSTIITAQNNAVKKADTIHSKILNEDRYIWVHVPKGASSKHYPVIYLLDGDVHFDEVNNILKRLSKETGKNTSNEMIVVGIGNIRERYRDYSPTHINSSPWVDDYTAKTTGGNGQFISFVQKELIPHINSSYPASSMRILLGHSMGGLAVINILLKHPALFDYYAAIDPSMWWDDQQLLKESKSIFAGNTFEKKSLFLAVANTMDKNMNVEQIRKDTSSKTVLIRPVLTLADNINSAKQNKLRFEWKFYKDDHHMTVPSPAMYDALKFFIQPL